MPERDQPGAREAAPPDKTPPAPQVDPVSRLPHRGPARLPDRAVVLEPGARAIAWKELRPGDACLNEAGLFPGVLMVELMAQAGGLLVDDSQGAPGGYGVLAGIKRMHLHAVACAGETIRVECSLVRRMGDLYMIECRARAEGGPAERALGHGTIQIRMVRGGVP